MAVLAYMPDIATQVAALFGLDRAPLWTHSMVVGAAAALPVATAVAPLLDVRLTHAFGLTLFSIWAHDLLDLLQSTDRVPLWPLASASFSPSRPWIPSGHLAETALFGALALGTWWWRRRATREARVRERTKPAVGAILVVGILVFAAVTSHQRGLREADAERAHFLVERGDASAALQLLDRAEKWPSPAKPGRIDYLRGAAYNEIGDRAAAERFYLDSLRKDPSYFWVVVDLAVFYAEAPGSVEERRRKAAPYVERLQRDFANEPELKAVLSRLERKLGSGGTGP